MKPVCPYCLTEIAAGDQYSCPACQTPHHQACWSENHGCTVYGCTQGPPDDAKITVGRDDQLLGGGYGSGAPPPPPPGPAGGAQYLIDRNGTRMGPYSVEDARHFLSEGRLFETDLAWREGMSGWLPLTEVLPSSRRVPPPPPPPPPPQMAPPPARQMALPATSTKGDAVFLYVPIARFVAMSLVTLGLYEVYWIYRNWRYLSERDNLNIQPFWKGWFGIFYISSLLKTIQSDPLANRVVPARFSPGDLAAGWIICVLLGCALSRASQPAVVFLGFVISAPSFLFLLPVQQYINRVNESLPFQPGYYRWSAGHTVLLIVGIIWWLGIFAALRLRILAAFAS